MPARLREAVTALDQPSMDGVNTFFVSWAARQVGLKVALSGLGGDEVFGGYPRSAITPRIAKLAMLGAQIPLGARANRWRQPCSNGAAAGSRQDAPTSCEKLPRCGGTPNRSAASVFLHAHAVHAPGKSTLLRSPALCQRSGALQKFARDLGSLGWTQTVRAGANNCLAIPRSRAWSCGPTCWIRCCAIPTP